MIPRNTVTPPVQALCGGGWRASILAAIVASAAGSGCLPAPAASAEPTMLPVPTEALELSDGARMQLPAERGKVVVLVFYAAWCPVSRKMLRAIADVSTASRRRRGLVVLPVDEEDGDELAKQFARAAGLTGPIGLDREGNFTRAMKLDTVPALVAVGRDGVVRRVHAGYHGEDDLAVLGREVDALLAAPRSPNAPGSDSSAPDEPAPTASAAAAPAPKP